MHTSLISVKNSLLVLDVKSFYDDTLQATSWSLLLFALCLPPQEKSKWTLPMGVGAMSIFVWSGSVEVCVQTPGQIASLRSCVNSWAVGTKTYLPTASLKQVKWSSRVCTLWRRKTWPSATLSKIMITPVTKTQPMSFAQVIVLIFIYFKIHLKMWLYLSVMFILSVRLHFPCIPSTSKCPQISSLLLIIYPDFALLPSPMMWCFQTGLSVS